MTRLRENNAASGIGVFATYSYTPTGQRAAVTYGNGTSRSYAYDTAGRTTGVKLDLAGAEHDLVIGAVAGAGTPVSYNPAGQIVSLSRSNDLYAWTAHSLFERDYGVNGINQYTSAGGVTLGHDGRGNLVQSGSSTYGYSRLNELTSAPNPLGGTIQLSYDPKGRLTQVNTATPVRMVYAGPNLVSEVSAAGTILRRYVHGPGADDPIVWYEGSGTASRRWLQADQLGSVVAISDASGTSLGINRYDEYGIPQSGNLGRFLYTGQTWWGELGLYNYKARWYSATLGRFMQTDPIGYKDNLNLYAYVGNDPVNGIDPTGMARVCNDGQGGVPQCVYVDGNGNGDAKDDDLSRSQTRQLGRHFDSFIAANDDRTITSFGKPVSNDAANPATADQVNMTRAVSQFVGASVSGGEAKQWANVKRIWASKDNSFFGRNNEFIPNTRNGQDGEILVGRRVGWFQGSIYSSASSLARVLVHEMQHSSVGYEYDGRVDARAIQLLRVYGLDSGGCPSANSLAGGSGC